MRQNRQAGVARETCRFAIAAGTAALVIMSLWGCGSSGSSKASGTTSQQPVGATRGIDFAAALGKPTKAICTGKHYTFGYDAFSDTDDFAVSLGKGLSKYASELGCVTIKKLVDNANPATAVQNANIFIQQHVDGAILFNVVQAASQGQSQALEGANIPIVSLAVPVQGKPFVTNDDAADGMEGGTALGKAYEAKKAHGPVYAIIGRYDGQASTKERMDGVVQGLRNTVPGVVILPIDTKVDAPTTQAATAAVLAKVPTGATILLSAANDDLTFAELQAVKQAGRQGSAMAIGIGGVNPTGLGYMCQNPQYVGAVGFFAENWPAYILPALIGEANKASIPSYPSKIVVPTRVITRANIAQYYPSYHC